MEWIIIIGPVVMGYSIIAALVGETLVHLNVRNAAGNACIWPILLLVRVIKALSALVERPAPKRPRRDDPPSMKICGQCRGGSPYRAAFCRKCGNALNDEISAEITAR